MKRTYVNRLPKNEEVKNTNVRIENGELVVEVEFKDRFEPKDGDFLFTNGGVFICNIGEKDNHLYAYAGTEYGKITINEKGVIWSLRSRCRFATPEEKSAFLERLEKECGKRWNKETKQLEDIRWKPNNGDYYFFVDSDGTIKKTRNISHCDFMRVKINNCFQTEESAQKAADQIKEIFKNSKAE